MHNPIRIVATKKLSAKQKQLLNADFSVFDEDFISIQNKEFAIENLHDYLIFTSQNAVESVLRNKKITEIKSKKSFCVGEKTKAALERNDFKVVAHADYAAELASIICNQYYKNSFTFFCGNIRRDVLPEALQLMEIELDEIEVYQTVPAPKKIDFTPDGVLFFSPSAVESYLKENEIKEENCFCIGNTTAEALKNKTQNIVIANQPTIESVILKTIENYQR